MILKDICILLEKQQKKPNGTYVGVTFNKETQAAIKKFVKANDIPNMVGRAKMHTTVIYSRKHFVFDDFKEDINPAWIGKAKEFHIWESRDDDKSKILVLAYDCPELSKEHERIMKKYDATYDFPKYIPHITLSYNAGENFDLSKLKVSEFPEIQIVGEYTTDLVLDWNEKS